MANADHLILGIGVGAVLVTITVGAVLWGGAPPSDPPAPFSTLYEGDSYYQVGGSYPEGCFTIRDPENWNSFWVRHSEGRFPEPATPVVDFGSNMVLGCFLGFQRTTGSSHIEIVRVELTETTYTTFVTRNYTQSDLPSISTPSHIVSAPFSLGTVRFVDLNTGAVIPVLLVP